MRFVRARDENESGVILIIVACAMVALIGMLSIAIDASYGFVQNRRAQNATDFAAFAAAEQLNSSYYCHGLTRPTVAQLTTIVQKLVDDNAPAVGTAWTATFLGGTGTPMTGPGSTFSPTGSNPAIPPNGACGVQVTAAPTWSPFFAGIFGVHKLQGYASGRVAPATSQASQIGIVALNKYGPHEILGGGTGTFVVSGYIYLNSDVPDQPWTELGTDPTTHVNWEWDDTIDAKSNSNLYVYGTILSSGGTYNGDGLWPLDNCFRPSILGKGPGSGKSQWQAGDPAPGQLPYQQMSCAENGGSVIIDFNNIDPNWGQMSDPLQAGNAPPNPLNPATDISCPGSPVNVVTSAPAGGFTNLAPGDYQVPVEITGNATFADCPGGYTGIYRFDDGLWINPGPGDTVTGNNVVIATQNPYPLPGNVPGSGTGASFAPSGPGNGAPCLPGTTMSSAASGNGTPAAETNPAAVPSTACGGTATPTYGVIAYTDKPIAPDPTLSGTGNNFSLIMGGSPAAGGLPASSVTLNGPTSGAYGGTNGQPGLVLYQDPTTEANYGFDAESGDGADITVNGVVYNASLPNYGLPPTNPQDYWDGPGGGIPFYSGGTLQAGYGAGWSQGPAPSTGTVNLTGTCIVDNFNTDGGTTITIVGEPYTLPGGGALSLIG
ncbi:MAG TPA: pilus assembly protein TadG-related protein [Acidimicrobiales bacterium]|nr:pilus assembly protein TadG-related protein [Acidimicrobiales bacterium]